MSLLSVSMSVPRAKTVKSGAEVIDLLGAVKNCGSNPVGTCVFANLVLFRSSAYCFIVRLLIFVGI